MKDKRLDAYEDGAHGSVAGVVEAVYAGSGSAYTDSGFAYAGSGSDYFFHLLCLVAAFVMCDLRHVSMFYLVVVF